MTEFANDATARIFRQRQILFAALVLAGSILAEAHKEAVATEVSFGAGQSTWIHEGEMGDVTVRLNHAHHCDDVDDFDNCVLYVPVRLHPETTANVRDSDFPESTDDFEYVDLVRFGPNETSKTFKVRTFDDDVVEGLEKIVFQFGVLPRGVMAVESPGMWYAHVYIQDNDTIDVSFGSTSEVATEGGAPAQVTVTLSRDAPPGGIAIPLRVGDTDAARGDYTVPNSVEFAEGQSERTFQVHAVDDEEHEGEEFLELNFGTLPDGVVSGAVNSVRVTIRDNDDPPIEVVFVNDGDEAATEGGAPAQVTVTLSRDAPPGGIAIPLRVGYADATRGDYTVPNSVEFAEGQSERTFQVHAVDDEEHEGEEFLELNFGTLPDGVVSGAVNSVRVTIRDNDDPPIEVVFVNDGDEAATEGGAPAQVTVTLSRDAPPGGIAIPLRVGYADATRGDYTVPNSVEFAEGQSERTFQVHAVDDEEHEGEEFLELNFGTLPDGVVSGAVNSVRVTIHDNDHLEAPGAPRNLTAHAGDGHVTLEWTEPQSDGGSPIIRYEYKRDDRPWRNTSGSGNRHVESNLENGTTYTFVVRAINAVNASSPGPESTSTTVAATPQIKPEEKEAVTETVRAVTAATASNIASNIGTRFAAARSGGTAVVVSGQKVNLGHVPSAADLATGANYRYRGLFEDDAPFDHERSLDANELLGSSAFEIALNAAPDGSPVIDPASVQWTVWGRGDLQFFSRTPDRGEFYDGDLKAGYLGVDGRTDGRWLLGLATSVTRTGADYGLGDASGEGGRLESTIRGVHPYLRYAPDDTSEYWSILGLGRGEITNDRTGAAEQETSDIEMRMVAAGARTMLSADEAWSLALLGDVGFARVETEEGAQAIQGLTVDAWRARVGVDGAYTALLESGSTLTTFVEVVGRLDGGGDEEEMGVEVSPGLYLANPEIGLGFEVRGRMLALHTAEDYEEYGASVTLSLSPPRGVEGLSLSLSPRWGTGAEKADTLWREDGFSPAGSRARPSVAMSLNAGVGYGVRTMGGVVTPFGEYSVHEQSSRRLRFGTRYSLERSSLEAFGLELVGERYDADGDDTDYRVGVVGRLRF